MTLNLGIVWALFLSLSAVSLYGLFGIVRMWRRRDRTRLVNLLWAELTTVLFVAGLATVVGTHGHNLSLCVQIMGVGLLVQAVRSFQLARKPDAPEPPEE